MPAVGLTDHGSLAGAVQLYQQAAKHGVKPIIGCEVYVCDDRAAQTKGYAHLTLLAESNEGYGNLIKLASAAYLQGYYYKPRVDWELLSQHSAGLIALSGCLSGRVSKALEESREGDAAADLDRLVQVFGRDSTYVEIQNAGLAEQARINPLLAKLAQGTGLPLVATGGARDHARGCRAMQRRDRARHAPAPEVPGAREPRRVRLPRRALREGIGEALRPGHAGDPGAAQVRAE